MVRIYTQYCQMLATAARVGQVLVRRVEGNGGRYGLGALPEVSCGDAVPARETAAASLERPKRAYARGHQGGSARRVQQAPIRKVRQTRRLWRQSLCLALPHFSDLFLFAVSPSLRTHTAAPPLRLVSPPPRRTLRPGLLPLSAHDHPISTSPPSDPSRWLSTRLPLELNARSSG